MFSAQSLIIFLIGELLVTDYFFQGNITEWKEVYFLAAALYACAAIVFTVFGSGQEQIWAKQEPREMNMCDEVIVNDNEEEKVE